MRIAFIALFACILCGTSFAESPVATKTDTTAAATTKVDSTAAAPAKVDTVKTASTPVKKPRKYLHILTNPFVTDIFVNQKKSDFASWPDYKSPAFIKIPEGDTTIQLTFFQREYADTTINVTLSSKDTSYLIVALRQHKDPDLTSIQDKELSHRSRRSFGRGLIISSGVPFIASAITAYLTHKYIESAKTERSHVQNSIIRTGDKYDQHVSNYHDDRDNARTAKKIAAISLGTGLSLLTLGIILSF